MTTLEIDALNSLFKNTGTVLTMELKHDEIKLFYPQSQIIFP